MAQCVKFIHRTDSAVGAEFDDFLTQVNETPCTGFVLLTPAEYSAMASNPFVLSVEDGALISGAIGGVWALAWALRAIRSALDTGGETNP